MTPLTEFMYFTKLPMELQLDIWDSSFPGPKIIEILYEGYRAERITAYRTPPALLHACRASRTLARRIYKPLFKEEDSEFGKMPLLYINTAIDTLYVPRFFAYGFVATNTFSELEHTLRAPLNRIALPYGRLHDENLGLDCWLPPWFLARFPKLDELIMVVDLQGKYWWHTPESPRFRGTYELTDVPSHEDLTTPPYENEFSLRIDNGILLDGEMMDRKTMMDNVLTSLAEEWEAQAKKARDRGSFVASLLKDKAVPKMSFKLLLRDGEACESDEEESF